VYCVRAAAHNLDRMCRTGDERWDVLVRRCGGAFVRGVAEGDATLVSEAMGYDVSSAEVSRWREEVLGLDVAITEAEPLLDEGDSESPDAALYFLDAIDSDEQRFSVEDGTLNEVVILVVKDRGWTVVTADPLEPID